LVFATARRAQAIVAHLSTVEQLVFYGSR
jgi:hypothetical protein